MVVIITVIDLIQCRWLLKMLSESAELLLSNVIHTYCDEVHRYIVLFDEIWSLFFILMVELTFKISNSRVGYYFNLKQNEEYVNKTRS